MVFAAAADAVLVIKRGGIKMGMKENAFAYIDAHRSEMLNGYEGKCVCVYRRASQ